MSNRGILQAKERWRYFKPTIAVAGTSGLVQPYFDESAGYQFQFGRYVLDPDTNFVTCEMQFEAILATTFGEGAAYVFRLPVPARRPVTADPVTRNCPIPIGVGMCYMAGAVAPNANIPCTATLADAFDSLQDEEDHWCQLYAPYILSWGSGSTATQPYSFNHRAGFAVNARDVEITLKDSTLSAAQSCLCVTATSSTQITVRNRAGSAPSGTMTFDWKVRAEPPSGQAGALVGPGTVSGADRVGCVPWDWTRFNNAFTPLPVIFINVSYEAGQEGR